MSISDIVYAVRKQGSVKVANKEQAVAIVRAGKSQGYSFSAQKQGWSFLVVDAD